MSYAAPHILLDALCLGPEVGYHRFVDGLVEHADDVALDVFLHQPSALVGQLYLCVGHVAGPARRVEGEHLLSVDVGYPVVVLCVVVAEEHDVEAGHLACHPLRGILFDGLLRVEHVGHADAAAFAAVEEADDEVGVLHLLQVGHPVAGAADHVLKGQSLPERLVEPAGYGGGEHADDGNLHAFALNHGVGVGVGHAFRAVDDVGAQHGTAHLADPFVVDGMTGLNVVVAEGGGVVAHVVDYRGSDVLFVGSHVVRPVARRLSLQDVAVVEQQQPVAIVLAQAVDVRVHACEGALQRFPLHEVVGEEVAVHVAGLDDAQLDGLGLSHGR